MRRRILAGTAMLVLAAACDRSSTTPDAAALSAAEVAEIAPRFEELADVSFAGATFSASPTDGARLNVTTNTVPFSRTGACPGGGSVTITGSAVYTADVAARTGSHAVTATRVESGCVLNVRRGGAVTIDGNPSTAITGSQSFTRGVPGIRTVTQKGAFRWSRGGTSGSCAVDLVSVFDPA
ncbi:MAG TPA: hypothetical protein VE913_17200, partial [Longimicrobium sp.]|nr:hypothetical protein [Longimicrobium sp.]